MHVLPLVLGLLLAEAPAQAPAQAQAQAPDPASGTGDVVLLRQPGIAAFEEATEGFLENCRVRVRQVTIGSGGSGSFGGFGVETTDFLRRVGPAQLVVAIGQAGV